jgi:two-component system, cell cycle sensor histidine kinase and response regulator CckA
MMVGALEAIFPGPRRLVLCALFAEPDRWCTVPQLTRKLALPERSVRQHLAVLACGGVVRSRRADRVTAYQPDPACPVFAELRSMLSTAAAGGGATVLIVEDQEATAQITRILLESWGYRVLEAHSGTEAMCLFEREGHRIGLLLADVRMPGMSGPQLALRLLEQRPDLRVVFMSGEPPSEPVCERAAFLAKPFTPATLARAVRRQLAQMKSA